MSHHSHGTVIRERRAAIARNPSDTGIDYIDVESAGRARWDLVVRFIGSDLLPGKQTVPSGITAANVLLLTGRERALGLTVESVQTSRDDRDCLLVEIVADEEEFGRIEAGDSPSYTLLLANVQHLDPLFNSAPFSLSHWMPHRIDPGIRGTVTPDLPEPAAMNYLAKDYASFRTMMFDHFALVLPEWTERNASDMGVAIVETLAYAADYLSYYQDAVATEAYLGTARQRTSIRRHARLLDYHVREGCNARTLVQVAVDTDARVDLPTQTQILSDSGLAMVVVDPLSSEFTAAIEQGAVVFETMHDAQLIRDHNEILLYLWGASHATLRRGSLNATLAGAFDRLQAGMVLVFEEQMISGNSIYRNPHRRHAVRLVEQPRRVTDPLQPTVPLTEITWHRDDALPFDLVIAGPGRDSLERTATVLRGNIVLADHGRTVIERDVVVTGGATPFRPRLAVAGITYRAPHRPPRTDGTFLSAQAMLQQDVASVLPTISLVERQRFRVTEDRPWHPVHDMLAVGADACVFVAEPENDGHTTLRFGDGIFGRKPDVGTIFTITYRVGNGHEGNIGPDTLAHVVGTDEEIIGVRNLIGGEGGSAPESNRQVQLYAPEAFQFQERCVTEEDYSVIAMRHTDVAQAVVRMAWTGAWVTAMVYVDPVNHRVADAEYLDEIRSYMEPYRVAGYGISIYPPYYIPAEIALEVYVGDRYERSVVVRRLRTVFSSTTRAGGMRGFFHPDNFSFGQPLYLSQVIAEAMRIDGVVRVDATTFQRWGDPTHSGLESGVLAIGPLEILRLDNDAGVPGNGVISFTLRGGL